MSKADLAPELLLDRYGVYEGPKRSEAGQLVISSSVSLAETQLFHSDPHLRTDRFPTPLQVSTPELSNSINSFDSETDSQANMLDQTENMHQLSMSEMKKMKSLLDKLIEKTESNVIKNNKPKSVPANVHTERVQSPVSPSPAIFASTEEKTIKPRLSNSSSSPENNHSDHTYRYDETLPTTDDGVVFFSVNPKLTAQVTKATGKNIAQLKSSGHNIGGTFQRPNSPTRNCSVPDKDKQHFPSALIEMNVKENTATALLREQKHEVVCALSSPILFHSHSGGFISNIDMTYYWCNFCPFKTEEKKELTQHVITHRFHCRHCNYQSFSRADVVNHSFDVHLEFQETSVSLTYCALVQDYIQVNRIQSTGAEGAQDEKASDKLTDEFNSFVISYDGKNNGDTTITKLPVSDAAENGEPLIVHPPSSPRKSLLAEQPSTSKRQVEQAELDSSKKSNPKKKHKDDSADDNGNANADDKSDDEGSVKKPKRSSVQKSSIESSSDSSSSDSDQEPVKNLMEIFECNSCEFKSKDMQKVREHMFRIHPGGKFYCIDKRIKKHKAKRYIFFCCTNKCTFQSTDPIAYTQHVDRCTPMPVIAKNAAKNSKPTGLRMTVKFAKKCLKKLSKTETKKPDKKSKVEDNYGCHYCKFETDSLIAVKSHLDTDHAKNSFVVRDLKAVDSLMSFLYLCKHCAWYSRDYSKLKNHMDREHRAPDKTLMVSTNSTEAKKTTTTYEEKEKELRDKEAKEQEKPRKRKDLQKPSQLYACDYGSCLFSDVDYKKFLFHNVAHEGGIVYECVHCNDWVSKIRDDFNIHAASLPDVDHNIMESTVEMDHSGKITRRLGDVVVKFEEP